MLLKSAKAIREPARGLRRFGIYCRPEPIIMEGSPEFRILGDKWTAVSVDDKRSAQFEHTVLITADGAEVLTVLPPGDEEGDTPR